MDQIVLRRKALRKKHRIELSLQLVFVGVLLLFLVLMLTQVLSVEGVDFPDLQIKDAVRQKLGPGIITKTSVSKIRNIDMSNGGFEDISGIESLWNLRSLNLSHNYLSDLKPLSGLEHLKELDLSYNNVYSLEGIENLVNLEKLNLEANIVKDLSPLKDLPNLKELNLNYNDITALSEVNISALAGSSLQILRLRDNYKVENDYTKIIHLNDVNGVQGLQELRRLDLRYNEVQDIRPIAELKNLEHLDLRENGLHDIQELTSMKSLRKLNLRGNELTDISPLQGLKKLSYLNLHSNFDIASIAPIQGLVQMDTLIVRNVPVGDNIRYISEMKKLHRINLQNCGISDPQIFVDLMTQGALQDGKKKSQRAEFNLLENDIQYQNLAQYSQMKDLWDNISLKAPFSLPRPINEDLQITLSHPSGFYEEEFDLTITCNDPNARILYTLDGSEPDIENIGGGKPYYIDYYNPRTWKPSEMFGSQLKERRNYTYEYTGPIRIKDRTNEPNDLSEIITTYTQAGIRVFRYNLWKRPTVKTQKNPIIKAVAYNEENYAPTISCVYFLNDHFDDELPIISIITDARNMFDFDSGIYVPGRLYFEAGGTTDKPLPPLDNARKPNYSQKGKYWERAATVEVFDRRKSVLRQQSGISTRGGASRTNPHKSLKITAKNNKYETTVFPIDLVEVDNKKYEHGHGLYSFLLRTGGSSKDYVRDASAQSIASKMKIATLRCQPAIQFVNGEYWGVCNIRDRYDDAYFAHNYKIDLADLIVLYEPRKLLYDSSKTRYGTYRDKELYNEVHRFIKTHSLENMENYEHFCTLIDINSFIDYNIASMYLSNLDWHGTRHFRMWRVKSNDRIDQTFSKWHFAIWDMDKSLGYNDGLYENLLSEQLRAEETTPTLLNTNSIIFVHAFKNETFRDAFIERSLWHIKNTFSASMSLATLDSQQKNIESQRKKHKERWANDPSTKNNLENMKVFMLRRANIYVKQLESAVNSDLYR